MLAAAEFVLPLRFFWSSFSRTHIHLHTYPERVFVDQDFFLSVFFYPEHTPFRVPPKIEIDLDRNDCILVVMLMLT